MEDEDDEHDREEYSYEADEIEDDPEDQPFQSKFSFDKLSGFIFEPKMYVMSYFEVVEILFFHFKINLQKVLSFAQVSLQSQMVLRNLPRKSMQYRVF